MAGLIKKQSLVDCFFMSEQFKILKVEKLPDSQASIVGELSLELLKASRADALKEINNRSNLPGFRPGHIPEETLVKTVGELKVLEEVAEVALGREYGNIVKVAQEKEKFTPMGRPTVAITKLAPGIPLEFKITLTLEPTFELPDYKKIAAEVAIEKIPDATDKEVDDVLEEIKKRDWKPELKEGEDLREKVKENIKLEKAFRNKEKHRLQIVENLVKATEVSIPPLLVEAELEKMIGQFKDDVLHHNLKWEDYLQNIKKTETEIRDEWREKARDRSKAELIVAKIAEVEKLEPQVPELEHESKHLLEHYPDADPLRLRIHVYQMLQNQKVLEFLESLK